MAEVFSILALLVSLGTFAYVARTYAVHYRPYVAIFMFGHNVEGNPPTRMRWRCDIKNAGSIPAGIEVEECSQIVTKQGQTHTVPVTILGKIYLIPQQMYEIPGVVEGAILPEVLSGTAKFEVHMKLNYEQPGWWGKKKYSYTSTSQFLSSEKDSCFVAVSANAN